MALCIAGACMGEQRRRRGHRQTVGGIGGGVHPDLRRGLTGQRRPGAAVPDPHLACFQIPQMPAGARGKKQPAAAFVKPLVDGQRIGLPGPDPAGRAAKRIGGTGCRIHGRGRGIDALHHQLHQPVQQAQRLIVGHMFLGLRRQQERQV